MDIGKIKKLIYCFSALTTIVYIFFRIFFTLPEDLNGLAFFAVVVLVVEIIDAFFYIIYVFNILIKERPRLFKAKIKKNDYPELDIFIATINEDVSLVEDTIKACKAMKYPNKDRLHFYLCDDGDRLEMRQLCRKYNVNYLARKEKSNAKAGNYNYALAKTNSPYIAVFDADMQPSKSFLLKTIPYLLSDKRNGFVQLPQSFNNPDLFQQRYKLWGYIPFEQDYFYHRIQPARNNHNSVIFCGTNAILSRAALEDVGGFAVNTVTEDFATGLLIEGHNFKGIALPDDEVRGLNVQDISSLLRQRARWCRGCIQTYKNYQILTNKGLNFRQKLDYLSGVYYWGFGIRNIIYLLTPLLYSFTNIKIIQGSLFLFITLFSIQYVLKRFLIDKLEGSKTSSLWNRIYEVILTPVVFFESIMAIVGLDKKNFDVTPKERSKKKTLRYYYSIILHIVLLCLNVAGLYATLKKYTPDGWSNLLIPIFWLSANIFYLSLAIMFYLSNSDYSSKGVKRSKKYDTYSVLVLINKFITKEIGLRRIFVTFGVVMIVSVASFVFMHYHESYKDTVVNYHTLVSNNRWLSIKDGDVINEYGEKVELHGVSTHNLEYFGNIYTKENIQELVNTWGINSLRIAVYTNPDEEGYITNKDIEKQVRKIIDYCIELDIYAILDWHNLKDNNPKTYTAEAVEFFGRFSEEYKDIPNVIYEICNEPNGNDVTWQKDVKPYAEKVTKKIRENSKKSLIVVGLADWCKDLASAVKDPLNDRNTLYSVHFYAGAADNQELRRNVIEAKKNKIPVIVTECGATDETGDGPLYEDNFMKWIDALDKNNIGWIVWQFSEKDEASSLLIKRDVQDRLDFLYKGYTEEELKSKKYHINDYLSDTGKYMKELFIKYSR